MQKKLETIRLIGIQKGLLRESMPAFPTYWLLYGFLQHLSQQPYLSGGTQGMKKWKTVAFRDYCSDPFALTTSRIHAL